MLQSTLNKSISQQNRMFNSDCGRLDSNTKSVRAKTKFRKEIFKMRKYSGQTLATEKDHQRGYNRTRYCGCAVKNPEVDKTPINVVRGQNGKVYYQGLQKCGNIWRCPVCNYKITQRRQLEVYDYCKHWFKSSKKNKISFITLTVHHTKTMTLQRSLTIVTDEYRRFQRTKVYKRLKEQHGIIGFIKSLEITYNDRNGWHPHLHILLFHHSDNTDQLHEEITDKWINREKVKGSAKGQMCKEVYGNEGISEYVTKWDTSKEMTKGSFKLGKGESITGFQMLKLLVQDNFASIRDKERTLALFKQYCRITYRKHKIHISQGLKKSVQEVIILDDDKILEDERSEELLLRIDQEMWKIITDQELEADILNIVEYQEFKHLYQVLWKNKIGFHHSPSNKLLTLKSINHEKKESKSVHVQAVKPCWNPDWSISVARRSSKETKKS